jgi:hypothetical protein
LRVATDICSVRSNVGNRQQLRKFIEDLSLVRAAVIANRSLCAGRLNRERQCRTTANNEIEAENKPRINADLH